MDHVSGTFVPLAAAFTDDGRSLSEIRLARLVRFWVERGAAGFYLNGESGEFLRLGPNERKSVVELVYRESQGALSLVVHVSSLSSSLSLDLAQHAGRHGAAAALVAPPYFGHYTPAELENHFRTIASFAGVRLIVADPSGLVRPELLQELGANPRIDLAEATDFDEWRTETARCSATETLGALLGPECRFETALAVHGPAVLMKAAYERADLELGAPRSPKLPILRSEFDGLLAA